MSAAIGRARPQIRAVVHRAWITARSVVTFARIGSGLVLTTTLAATSFFLTIVPDACWFDLGDFFGFDDDPVVSRAICFALSVGAGAGAREYIEKMKRQWLQLRFPFPVFCVDQDHA